MWLYLKLTCAGTLRDWKVNRGYSALDRSLQTDASTDVKVVETLEQGLFLITWSTLGSFLENWKTVEDPSASDFLS